LVGAKVEAEIIKIGSALGGFAGLVAMVLMVWFLRLQSASQKADAERILAERQQMQTLVTEIVAARRESNEVIRANTKAWTEAAVTLKEISEQFVAHDDHARDAGDMVRHVARDVSDLARNLARPSLSGG